MTGLDPVIWPHEITGSSPVMTGVGKGATTGSSPVMTGVGKLLFGSIYRSRQPGPFGPSGSAGAPCPGGAQSRLPGAFGTRIVMGLALTGHFTI
jgi:hypothetical protein